MKVYLAMYEDIANIQVHGVFSLPELAREYINSQEDPENYWIMEWMVDYPNIATQVT